MKKIIFAILLLSSISGYSQSLDEKFEQLYKSEYFKGLDLIITPSIFNPGNEENISYIEFFQDSTANFNDSWRIYASIDVSQSKTINYIVGTIGDYQAEVKSANVIIKKVYKDGTSKTSKVTINFDDILPPGVVEAEYAEYSVDVEITAGNLEWL